MIQDSRPDPEYSDPEYSREGGHIFMRYDFTNLLAESPLTNLGKGVL